MPSAGGQVPTQTVAPASTRAFAMAKPKPASSAKAALESDTRTLAMEVGRRWGLRVNTISAGPLASRAATAIGKIGRMIEYCRANSPISRDLNAMDVGYMAAFLASPMAAAITATTVYVDNGYHSMGMGIEQPVLQGTD